MNTTSIHNSKQMKETPKKIGRPKLYKTEEERKEAIRENTRRYRRANREKIVQQNKKRREQIKAELKRLRELEKQVEKSNS